MPCPPVLPVVGTKMAMPLPISRADFQGDSGAAAGVLSLDLALKGKGCH